VPQPQDSSLPELLRQLLSHPLILFAVLAAVGSALKAMATRKPPASSRPLVDPRKETGGESDLEARVRRNFEEMMRRRAASSAPTAPRPVVDYDTQARPEPTSTEGPRAPPVVVRKKVAEPTSADKALGPASLHLQRAAKAVEGNVRSAAATRFAKRARALDLRRGALEPRTIRQAVLLREILDPPVALRG
jgi:hypothetical protein